MAFAPPPIHPLLVAAAQGSAASVRAELEKFGPGPLARAAHDGVDPLMLACTNDRVAAVSLLARFGGFGLDPNKRNPLHYAALYNKPRCMRLLAKLPEASAWACALDSQGSSPLHDACLNDSIACVRILSSLIDLSAYPEIGRNAILTSAVRGASNPALWLLKLYPHLTSPRAAFLAACQSQDPEAIENFGAALHSLPSSQKADLASSGLLIHCGIPFLGYVGFAPWILARQRSNDERCTRVLISLGANPSIRDAQGFTPLALAAVHGRAGSAPLLLGLTPAPLAPGRRSAARLARENNHRELACELASFERAARLADALERASSKAIRRPRSLSRL